MNEKALILNIANELWTDERVSYLPTKKVDVKLYKELHHTIPDSFLLIEEVFPEEELDDIWTNYKPYLAQYNIFPVIGTLGDAVICIGYSQESRNKVYYFDFDFGCISFDNQDLEEFILHLVNK